MSYTYKLLTYEDIDIIYDLQEYVVSTIEDKNFFRPSTKEMLSKFISNGYILGAFINHKLIAYRVLFIPNQESTNLGYDLNFDKNDLQKVVHLETALVHPRYRGDRLQVKLTKEIKKYFDLSDKIICSTCYPFNYPSLSNLIKMGLVIVKLKNKYNNMLRFILTDKKSKALNDNFYEINNNNLEEISNLLKSGYFGNKIGKKENEKNFNICFQKRVWC